MRKAGAQLFIGQTTHLLSSSEKGAFYNKIKISGHSFFSNEVKKCQQAIQSVLETPTACEQARQTSQFDEKFSIKIEDNLKYDGIFRSEDKQILISAETLASPAWCGHVVLRELLHARQKVQNPQNNLLCQAEANALQAQLSFEQPTPQKSDFSYNQSVIANCQKWFDVALAKNPTPDGMLKLTYAEGLSTENQLLAKQAYAYQMASAETRLQYIKDFLKTQQEWTLSKALPIPSYIARSKRLHKNFEQDFSVQTMCDLAKRFPYMNPEKLPAFINPSHLKVPTLLQTINRMGQPVSNNEKPSYQVPLNIQSRSN